jgi:DNA-binding PadR family transcriptional regulator
MSLRAVILSLLSRQPNTGYGLGRTLRQDLNHIWEARLQQIYGELANLTRERLVDVRTVPVANRPAKKVYSLTSEGEHAFDMWLAGPSGDHVCRDGLLVRVYSVGRLSPEAAVAQLQERSESLAQRAAVLRLRAAQVPHTDPARIGEVLTIEAVLARTEAEAAWCDRAIGVLERACGTDLPAGDQRLQEAR